MPKDPGSVAAANNSTCSAPSAPVSVRINETTVIEPSTEAVEQFNRKAESWKRCWRDQIMRTPFFDEPQIYSVIIHGSKADPVCGSESGLRRKAYYIESVVEAYHPYMAIGQAVMDYMTDMSAAIEEIHIYRRVVKTITSKKSKCQI